MLVLGLVGVLGLGFLAFKLLGPSDAPKGSPKEVGTSAANDVRPQPQPVKNVVPDPPEPTPPTPEPTPEPTPPEPTPSDSSAAAIDPPVEEPTKKPTTPKVPKTPTPKVPAAPKGDPVALLEDARKASMSNNATQAYELARKSYEIDKNVAALKLMGVSACKMGDPVKAKSAYKKLDAALQKQLQSVCQDKGITLE